MVDFVVDRRLMAFFVRSIIVMGLVGISFFVSRFSGGIFWAMITFGLMIVYLVGVVDGEQGVWG